MNFNDMLNLPISDCEFFLWDEALWLEQWSVHAVPSAEVEKNIIETARRMMLIRNFLSRPIRVTSWYRPPLYNKVIGGALRSQHLLGRACDFQIDTMGADVVRSLLLPRLAEFNVRMENLPGSPWVHIDIACTENMPPAARYFKP